MDIHSLNRTWVISDTHFLHSNSIDKWKDGRQHDFKNVHHMDETLIENWNRYVQPGDKVYHLGDVFIGNKDEFKKLWPRLNGKKNLIVGNHDDIKFLASGAFFRKIYQSKVFRYQGHKFVMTHHPIRLGDPDDYHRDEFNIHGHVHRNNVPDSRYFNVSVENIGYKPVLLQTVLDKLISLNR